MKFDPMTGEPIEETAQEVKPKTVTKFDPMTGEPIEVVVDETTQKAPQAQETQPAQSFMQKLLAKPAMLGVIGVVAVVAIVIIAALSGAFMSDRDRVATAIINTLSEQGEVGDALVSLAEVYENKENTTALMVEYQGVEVRAEYRHTAKDKQVWASADGVVEGLEGTLTLGSEQVQATTPLLEDVLFVYNYKEDNDGYLMDSLPEYQVEMINSCLEAVYAIGSDESKIEISDDTMADLKEWYKEIEVEKVDDKEEYEINDKEKACTGYTMEIDEAMLGDLFEILGDVIDETGALDGMGVSVNDFVDEMKDEISGMPDLELTFYLDSKKLAAVVVEIEGEEMELLFKGGEYRMQNMELEYEGTTIMEIEGETEGKVETVKLEVQGQKFFQYEYDSKSGEFEAKVYDYYGDVVASVETTITAKGGAVTLADGNIDIDGTSVDFEFSAKKGAKIEKLSGEEFNVGEASYSDWSDVAEELYDALY